MIKTTVTGVDGGLTQPFTSVTVTLYDPGEATLIEDEVAPLLHWYEAAGDELRVAGAPLQTFTVPEGVIIAVGNGNTVTFKEVEVPLQPFASITDRLTVLLLFTVIVELLLPFDQVLPFG